MIGNNFVLWENEDFLVKTPFSPHMPYSDGPHLVVAPHADMRAAWDDVALGTEAFALATQLCKIMDDIQFAPWFNIPANGNWGFLPGNVPFFHIHIYGRNHGESWGKPITLPEAPGTYQNDPMPETDRERLIAVFNERLS